MAVALTIVYSQPHSLTSCAGKATWYARVGFQLQPKLKQLYQKPAAQPLSTLPQQQTYEVSAARALQILLLLMLLKSKTADSL